MHSLIVGPTECGKTTLGKKICSGLRQQGHHTLVLTSVYDEWDCDFMTDDQDKFLDTVWASQECFIFVDEGLETVGRFNKPMISLASKSRHWGHSCFFMVQSAAGIDPIIRRQCSQLFLFTCAPDEVKSLSSLWLAPDIQKAPSLRQGQYIRALRFKDGKPFAVVGDAFSD